MIEGGQGVGEDEQADEQDGDGHGDDERGPLLFGFPQAGVVEHDQIPGEGQGDDGNPADVPPEVCATADVAEAVAEDGRVADEEGAR